MNGLSTLVRILVIATGGKKLTPHEENIGAWVLVIGLVQFVLRVSIVLLIGMGITHRSLFTEDVFFL